MLHMLVAMAVILVPIAAVTWFFTRTPPAPIIAVNPTPFLQQATAESPYKVLVPRNVPAEWTCVRARWTPLGTLGVPREPAPGNTWQLGYLTTERMYLALDQRDFLPDQFVTDVTRKGRATGQSSVAGQSWERFTSADGRTRSLVKRDAASVAIVSGDVSFEALDAFAATLAPA